MNIVDNISFRLTIGVCKKLQNEKKIDLLNIDPGPFFIMDFEEDLALQVMEAMYLAVESQKNGNFNALIEDMGSDQYAELKQKAIGEITSFSRAISVRKTEIAMLIRDKLAVEMLKFVEKKGSETNSTTEPSNLTESLLEKELIPGGSVSGEQPVA